ncbi:hypothetical protein E0Z10_g9676 [Xylaria hypoxylon]|uniref:Uncharacterized protein n=1 Tax=Xylaria hypoxylon TaxID=37992 RepID=A0A4Z0YGK8_9PEZI|nr:hypothetical protein E0Z10_g9676 [Xylaria hypoxylon]
MAPMNARSNTNQRPRQCASTSPRPTPHWQLGDIAFLKHAERFSQTERTELLESGRVYSGATGHPVIILDRSDDSQHYIVMTVSAYASSEYNDYLPPWKQGFHARKDINGFRAFEGSARPNNNKQHLRLADGKTWPKVKTSWVYIYHHILVPASTLINYDKSRSQLRMAPESLQDLVNHIQGRSWRFREQKSTMNTRMEPSEPVAKNFQRNFRQDDKENHQRLPGNIAQPPSKPCPSVLLERTGLNNTSATGSKPLWSTIAAKSTSTATSLTCKAQIQPHSRRGQTAVLA